MPDSLLAAKLKTTAPSSGIGWDRMEAAVEVLAIALANVTVITGAISVGDGVDVSQGAVADAAVTNPASSGSVIALLKGILTESIAILALTGKDAGPSWATANGIAGVRFTSADQSASAAVVTSAPTSGQKLVITDIELSVDTAMRVDFSIESDAGTIISSIYMAANSSVNIVTRSKRKLATADKKLAVRTSAAGNITVNAFYYSEA